jgi:hypothetical protein
MRADWIIVKLSENCALTKVAFRVFGAVASLNRMRLTFCRAHAKVVNCFCPVGLSFYTDFTINP